MIRTVSLSQIEGLDKLDASGHTKPLSLWDKADIQQWLISIGSKRHQKRFMETDMEVRELCLSLSPLSPRSFLLASYLFSPLSSCREWI
jgi:hypothetical protein